MSRKNMRFPILGLIALAMAAVAILVLFLPRWLQPTLEAELARDLNIPREDLVINVPPGPQRVPGSIFVADRQFIALDLLSEQDPRILAGPGFRAEWQLKDWSVARGSAAFSVASEIARSQAARQVSLLLTDARVLEMSGPDLKQRLQLSQPAQSHGSDHLIIIVRCIVASPVVRVLRNRGAALQDWILLKERAQNVPGAKIRFEGQSGDEDSLSFETPDPVVFAFEVAKADYVLNHLGIGAAPPEIKLTPLTAAQLRKILEHR